MKCPHCKIGIHYGPTRKYLDPDKSGMWSILRDMCPECRNNIFTLQCFYEDAEVVKLLVYPKAIFRDPVPKEVPEIYAEDYTEACLILADSPKASAALSRRCLQLIIRDELKITRNTLFKEIDEVIKQKKLSTSLNEAIDDVRKIGNLAAHPKKNKNTGEIVPVEIGEAEWNLETLERLFDYLFVQPETIKQRRAELYKKIEEADKKPST